MTTLLLSLLMAAPGAPCATIDSDRIEMRHLRSFLQPGVELDSQLVFGSSPQPGVRRTVSAGEFIRWAKAHGAAEPHATDGCFEWETRQLTENEVVDAMQASLDPNVDLKLIEVSHFSVPKGKVIFERNSLYEPSLLRETLPVIWNGYVQYSQNRKVKIWGKVILSVSSSRVSAIAPINAGDTIAPEQIREEKIKQFPYLRRGPVTAQDFAGRVARRSLREGAVLSDSDVVPQMDVKKGDMVVLEAPFGHGLLRTQAVAQAAARIGERVLLRNAESGKVMQAKLVSATRAVVISGLMPLAAKGSIQ